MLYKSHINNNIEYLTYNSLDNYKNVIHCFTTKKGGVSKGCFESLNLGYSIGDEIENVNTNFKLLADALNIDVECFTSTAQTHSTNIRVVTEKDRGKGVTKEKDYDSIDGLITNVENVALITKHADCTPVLFYDPIKKVIGAAHAGWMGTLNGISEVMIDKFIDEFGSDSKDIIACIGPSLCQNCFEVDIDVADMFVNANPEYKQFMIYRSNKAYIDLWKINRFQLTNKGVKNENITCMELCTKCNLDKFYSHRGQHGKRGLMGSVIMLKNK